MSEGGRLASKPIQIFSKFLRPLQSRTVMPLLDETAAGVYVIAATPFGADGGLDLDSVDRMVDFYAQRGADGLTLLGIMGEAPKLTAEEAGAFLARAIKRMGAMPAIVGVSAP